MKYIDKLSASNASGWSIMAASLNAPNTIEGNIAVGVGAGLVASGFYETAKSVFCDYDPFEELRNEFEKRERWYNKSK
jgi:hypothetical protein